MKDIEKRAIEDQHAKSMIERGCEAPWDDRLPRDGSQIIALGVLHALYAREPIGGVMREVDMETREEIVDETAAIIRYGYAMPVEFIKTFVVDESDGEDIGKEDEPPTPI